jgi:hypothetical protein
LKDFLLGLRNNSEEFELQYYPTDRANGFYITQ